MSLYLSTGQQKKTGSLGLWARPLAALAVCLGAAWCDAGAQNALTKPQTGRSKTRAELMAEMQSRRQDMTRKHAEAGRRAFVDERGVFTLTNKVNKYRQNPKYTEIELDYEPIVVAPKFRKLSSPVQYSNNDIESLVSQYAKQYGLSENLVYAVIRVESNGNPYAVSRAGASGLMQLMPGTAAEMGVTDIFDPAQNIAAGTQYLYKLLKVFKGNMRLALAGYNAGPENVKKYGGIPPFKETQNYVASVFEWSKKYSRSRTKPAYLYRVPAQGETPMPKLAQADGAQAAPKAKEKPSDAPVSVSDAENKTFEPVEDKLYKVYLKSGWTQPAEKIVESDSHYYVEYKGVISRIRKEHVKEISEPA